MSNSASINLSSNAFECFQENLQFLLEVIEKSASAVGCLYSGLKPPSVGPIFYWDQQAAKYIKAYVKRIDTIDAFRFKLKISTL